MRCVADPALAMPVFKPDEYPVIARMSVRESDGPARENALPAFVPDECPMSGRLSGGRLVINVSARQAPDEWRDKCALSGPIIPR